MYGSISIACYYLSFFHTSHIQWKINSQRKRFISSNAINPAYIYFAHGDGCQGTVTLATIPSHTRMWVCILILIEDEVSDV